VVVDEEHRPLVSISLFNRGTCIKPPRFPSIERSIEENQMGRGLLLWLLGVPIPVIILLWLFFGH
jgi:hypothetical protein